MRFHELVPIDDWTKGMDPLYRLFLFVDGKKLTPISSKLVLVMVVAGRSNPEGFWTDVIAVGWGVVAAPISRTSIVIVGTGGLSGASPCRSSSCALSIALPAFF